MAFFLFDKEGVTPNVWERREKLFLHGAFPQKFRSHHCLGRERYAYGPERRYLAKKGLIKNLTDLTALIPGFWLLNTPIWSK